MDTGKNAGDYGLLNVRTRPGASERGRSRVMIVMHEDDRAYYEPVITSDVLEAGDCAVFTLKPGAERVLLENAEEYSYHLQVVGEMRIMVAVVTERFLAKDNFARLVQVPQALSRNVAVLPVVVERGLVERFNSDPLFGGMQFLDRTSTDTTEISYSDKLKRYMDSLILTQEEVGEIRRHHTGRVFISYRKKDRPLARKLMTLIHDVRADLAVWFDEFLTPGKHFDEEIEDTIKGSDIFAMAMTPNMLEKPNYVEEHEYRTAVDSSRDKLPVTMEDLGGADVNEVYPGIGECLSADDTGVIADHIDAASDGFGGYKGNTRSAEHLYMIALGYLNGIDAETDGARAEKLLKEAAALKEGGYSKEAYRKLVSMYVSGAGAERDRTAAKDVQTELAKYCAEVYTKTDLLSDLADMINEYILLGNLYYDDNETSAAAGIYEPVCKMISRLVLEESPGQDPGFCSRIKFCSTMGFSRLAVLHVESGDHKGAAEYLKNAASVDKQIADVLRDRAGTEAILEMFDEIITNEHYAFSEKADGNYRDSIDLYLRNAELDRKIIELAPGSNDPEGNRNTALIQMTGWYSRAAGNAVTAGWYDEARDLCSKSLKAFNELGGEFRLMGEPDYQGEVFWTYFHLSEVGRLTCDLETERYGVENAVRVLNEITLQSGADRWETYLFKMNMRLVSLEYRDAVSRAETDEQSDGTSGDDIACGEDDDLPYDGSSDIYTIEDLKETVEMAEYMVESGYSGEAYEYFDGVLLILNEGRYTGDVEEAEKMKTYLDARLKELEEVVY